MKNGNTRPSAQKARAYPFELFKCLYNSKLQVYVKYCLHCSAQKPRDLHRILDHHIIAILLNSNHCNPVKVTVNHCNLVKVTVVGIPRHVYT